MIEKDANDYLALHGYILDYLNLVGANVTEENDEYFVIEFKDGLVKKYTYKPVVASEHSDIDLIAIGSTKLESIFSDSAKTGCALFLNIRESKKQIEDAIFDNWKTSSKCCDKCPQIGECTSDTCCIICPERIRCHHLIVGGELKEVNKVYETKRLLFQLAYLIEIGNPIRKQDKIIEVLIDPITETTYEALPSKYILEHTFENSEFCFNDLMSYDKALQLSRIWVEQNIEGSLGIFRLQTDEVVAKKHKALKYRLNSERELNPSSFKEREDYEHKLKQLFDQYQINIDITLVNCLAITTPDYQLELKINGKSISVVSNPVTNKVAHPYCPVCGQQAFEGLLCINGHYVCSECATQCVTCGKIYCRDCSSSQSICSICGEYVCETCKRQCSSCNQIVCRDHIYSCYECKSEELCLSCSNICELCNKSICSVHTHECHLCGHKLCEECTTSCYAVGCSNKYCSEHVKECTVCHKVYCFNHLNQCDVCSNWLCEEHINHCLGCGKSYCFNEESKVCNSCGQAFCVKCINADGLCQVCSKMSEVDCNHKLVHEIILKEIRARRYKNWKIGSNNRYCILEGKGTFGGTLFVLNSEGKVTLKKELQPIRKIQRS